MTIKLMKSWKRLFESKNKQFRYLIFDLSGVHYIDTYVTSYLIKIINSLKMMGVKVIITGLTRQQLFQS
ncbi:STAS domain-containing protein [Alteribacillus bidgolensis]|uniref:STAS domain-containing protein n=1 Tax=Alteribacillus bidgolensis TaxID=930129 RepID=UPI000B85CFBA